MRALLIVNPHATSTTRPRRDVIVRALASAVDLEVVQTRYRGDASRLAASAAADKFDLVMTLGGDGTVNEAVNGLRAAADGAGAGDLTSAWARGAWARGALARGDWTSGTGARGAWASGADGISDGYGADQTGRPFLADAPAGAPQQPAWPARTAADLPALAALPGGNANVFTRSLRIPHDPVDAAAQLIDDLGAGRERCIGLGWANGRYFTFNAGVGLDAEVVRAVEGRRAHGHALTPALFLMMALRQYYRLTDRRHPALLIQEPAGIIPNAVYECIVSNSAPWTYLGSRPVNTNPNAGFDTGLDLFALRSLSTPSTLRTLRQMLSDRTEPPRGRGVTTAHDLDTITVQAHRPVAFQVDGEYMGEAELIEFRSVPGALRVIGLSR